MTDSLPPGPVPAFYAVALLIMAWDIVLAGRISQLRRGTRYFLALSALCGLLVVPAVLVAATSTSILNGRAVYIIAWLWPLTAALFAAQSVHALVRGHVHPLIGLPIAVANVTICAGALSRYASVLVVGLPDGVAALGAAQAGAMGFIFGRAALVSAYAIPIPILAPAYPARWRSSRGTRIVIASIAAVWSLLYLAEYPQSVRATVTFRPFSAERLQERPRGDFLVGVRILPTLDAPPPPLALVSDLSLADTVDADVLSVVVAPGGSSSGSLDSLARALEETRRDSTLLVAALGYDAGDRERYRHDPERYLRSRLAASDRIMRSLRPDILLPALDPATAGLAALGPVPIAWWARELSLAAVAARRVRPRTLVGVSASAFTPWDSALYAWGAAPTSPLDLVGFSFYPSYGGGVSLAARLRTAEHWMRGNVRPQWVFAVGTNPRLFGESNQERALWGTLAWATSQPRVQGLIVDGAGDYDTMLGLRAPGGRLRPAVATLARARRALAEAALARQ